MAPPSWPSSPSFVTKINGDPNVGLVVHLGDIKNGSSTGTDAYFATVRGLFDTFQDPFVYTPGDSEWTDCHRTNNGGYFPPERLAAIRSRFFPMAGQTLGVNKKQVLTQASDAGYSSYVENTMWMVSKVVFSALNLPGSNNDLMPWTSVTPQQARLPSSSPSSRAASPPIWRGCTGPSTRRRRTTPRAWSCSCRPTCGTPSRRTSPGTTRSCKGSPAWRRPSGGPCSCSKETPTGSESTTR